MMIVIKDKHEFCRMVQDIQDEQDFSAYEAVEAVLNSHEKLPDNTDKIVEILLKKRVWEKRAPSCEYTEALKIAHEISALNTDHPHMCMKCGSRMITRDTGDYVVPAPETDAEIAERVFIKCFELPGKGEGAKFKMLFKHYELYLDFCKRLAQIEN